MAGHIATSKSTHWCTPESLLKPCYEIIKDKFDLDPCSNENSIVKSKYKFTLPVDGLKQDWSIHNNIFINPPFGRDKERSTHIGYWVEKTANTYRENSAGWKFLLLPASVDTKYWQKIIFRDHGLGFNKICFLEGRVTFLGEVVGPCPMPIAMVCWTKYQYSFETIFSALGKVF